MLWVWAGKNLFHTAGTPLKVENMAKTQPDCLMDTTSDRNSAFTAIDLKSETINQKVAENL